MQGRHRHRTSVSTADRGGALTSSAPSPRLALVREPPDPIGSAAAQLALAIDANDLARVQPLMTREPALHRAARIDRDPGLVARRLPSLDYALALLLDRGADASVRATVPGDYERPGEVVECTALGYALLFGGANDRPTVALLRERGAVAS